MTSCYMQDDEYKKYLINYEKAKKFRETRPLNFGSKWDEFNKSFAAYEKFLVSKKKTEPENHNAQNTFKTMNFLLSSANKSYSVWYDLILQDKKVPEEKKINPEFWTQNFGL
ncbi:hypothetical protein [Mycoplasmopsis primatum]|uniref:hypothetical protein n=1 Tax=Mycoplasmopsis primatum TaxID=55604 RepID=UPI0012EC3375|nr:hypothetical protein [Mycoplasmopsis primatum]